MDSKTVVDRAVDAMYRAALDPAEWPRALRLMSHCLGSAAACVFIVDDATQRVAHWVGLGLEFGQKEYLEHYGAIDPRRLYAAAHPETRIHYDYMLIDERGMDRNEFYDWQRETTDDLRYFLGCRIHADRDHTAFAAFHWPRRRGHVQASHIRLFKQIVPHFERALQLGIRLDAAQQREASTRTVIDQLQHAVVLLDDDARVVFVNRAAEAILFMADGLGLTARGLVAQGAEDQAALQRLIASAAMLSGAGGVLAVSRVSGGRPYAVLVSSLPREPSLFAIRAPAVAVFITDPEQRQELPETMLVRLYGLTPAEAAVAARIAAGVPIKRVAGELEIATNTARLHLQRVMNKTGAHRQGELVRLLLAAIPPGRD